MPITYDYVTYAGNIFILFLFTKSKSLAIILYRGSYMSAQLLLNLLNELGKKDNMRGMPSVLSLFTTSLINSIIQEHEC